MSDIRILRIEATKNNKIIIDYEEVKDEYRRKFRCWDDGEAAPAFYDAIKALSIHATSLCELPESYASRIVVKAVKYTYKGDEEIMGAKMLVGMKLSHSDGAVSCWTPHKPSVPYDPNAKEPYGDKALTEKCVLALWELDRQAQLYIKGERSQITLDFESAEKTEEFPPDEEIKEMPEEHDEMIEDIPLDTNIVNFPSAANSNFSHA